jgi:hypothetical protein
MGRHLRSGGPFRIWRDTRGHAIKTVRDREDPGSNPGPPTNFVFKIDDFLCGLESAAHSRITISRKTIAILAFEGGHRRRI